PWFRHNFPQARLLHLYRHPRDQWLSSLVDPSAFRKEGTMVEFAAHDHFYLRRWASDLKYHFPFLDERYSPHAYQTFYYLWKLSYLFGRAHADHSLAFEDLLRDPEYQLAELFRKFSVTFPDMSKLKSLIVQPRAARWRAYAPEEWFQEQEAACERVL